MIEICLNDLTRFWQETYGGTSIFLQGASGDTGPMISYSADPAVSSQC